MQINFKTFATLNKTVARSLSVELKNAKVRGIMMPEALLQADPSNRS